MLLYAARQMQNNVEYDFINPNKYEGVEEYNRGVTKLKQYIYH